MEEYIGMITLFAGNYEPQYYMFCHGQILPIQRHTALFSILGTTYGGNGTTTFALPDFRTRVLVGAGQGNHLSNVHLGETGGSSTAIVNAILVEPAKAGGQNVSISSAGTGTHSNIQPSLGLNYIICVDGIYPSRP